MDNSDTKLEELKKIAMEMQRLINHLCANSKTDMEIISVKTEIDTNTDMVNENTTQRGMNEDLKLIEQPILLDTSRPDNGCNNDNKDSTKTGLKSTFHITSSDYNNNVNKDSKLNKRPIQTGLPDSDNGCKNSDTDYKDNRTEDPIYDEEVIFDYTNYKPQNSEETMVEDLSKCDCIYLPTNNMALVSNNEMKLTSTSMYYDIKCVHAATASARVRPIYEPISQMVDGMLVKDSKILGRTVWDPGVKIANDIHLDC